MKSLTYVNFVLTKKKTREKKAMAGLKEDATYNTLVLLASR